MIDIFLIILRLLLFTAICFVFGWLIIERFLKEKSPAFKIGGSFLLGFSGYTFLLNLSSYFIAIKLSFYLVLFVFLLFILFNSKSLVKQIKGIKTLNLKKFFNPVSITVFIIFLSIFWIGLGFYREDLMPVHIPTAATIAEGNFPIFHVAYPSAKLIYHYAPELLAAAIYKITGLSLWLVYDFLFAFFTCLIFVFGFVVAKQLVNKFKTAYWSSLIMMLAGGFYFIYGFSGIKSLILKQNIEAPFAFLSSVLGSDYLTEPLIQAAGNHNLAFAWGFVLTLAVLYLFLRFFIKDNKKWFSYSIIISIVFGFLALSSEVLFIILGIIFVFYLLFKRRIQGILTILLVGGAIALLQGGVLSQLLDSVDSFNKWTLRLSDTILIGDHVSISLFSLTMLKGLGLSIILLPFAIFYWRKKRDVLLLALFPALVCLLAPFMAEYAGVGDFQRFFIIALAFFGLFAGLYLGDLLERYPAKKIIIYLLILLIILNGLTYYLFGLFYPAISAYRHSHSLVAITPFPDKVEQKAYNWIKSNTKIQDPFLVKRHVLGPVFYKQKYGGEAVHQFVEESGDFITNTGRLIINKPWCETKWCNGLGPIDSPTVINELDRLDRAKQACKPDALNGLGVKFIYLEADYFTDFEKRCLQNNNLELKFEASEGNKFIRIYKVL